MKKRLTALLMALLTLLCLLPLGALATARCDRGARTDRVSGAHRHACSCKYAHPR